MYNVFSENDYKCTNYFWRIFDGSTIFIYNNNNKSLQMYKLFFKINKMYRNIWLYKLLQMYKYLYRNIWLHMYKLQKNV